jgi:hypothetical protein
LAKEIVSKATRNAFRQALAGYVLREIVMIFEAAGIEVNTGFQSPVSGQRRALVEQYYASLDFSSVGDTQKLVIAFEELLERLRQTRGSGSEAGVAEKTFYELIRRMERDGFGYKDGRFSSEILTLAGVEAPTLIALTEISISEHIEKARSKIAARDYSGAISSAYTLVEGFLKELLRRTGTPFSHDEGIFVSFTRHFQNL